MSISKSENLLFFREKRSNELREFTRYEYQYIYVLAVRAKQGLEKDIEDDIFIPEIDTNILGYIETLDKVIGKCKRAMEEYDNQVSLYE